MRSWRIKRRRADPKLDWWRRSVCAAKARAKQQGLAFDLETRTACCEIPDVCPALGIKLDYALKGGKKGPRPCSPSIDRIVPELGYVQGNVAVISHRANAIKQNATVEEIEQVLEYARRVSSQS